LAKHCAIPPFRSLRANEKDGATLFVIGLRREKQMQILRLVREGGLAQDDNGW
jgi:hypothetical protein